MRKLGLQIDRLKWVANRSTIDMSVELAHGLPWATLQQTSSRVKRVSMLIISWTDYMFQCLKHFCPDQNHLRSKWEQQNFTNTSTGRRDTGYCDNCNTCKRNMDTHLQGVTGCKWAAGPDITGTLAGQKHPCFLSRSNFRQDWNHESEVLGVQPRALTMLWLRYKNTKRMVSPVDPETI